MKGWKGGFKSLHSGVWITLDDRQSLLPRIFSYQYAFSVPSLLWKIQTWTSLSGVETNFMRKHKLCDVTMVIVGSQSLEPVCVQISLCVDECAFC